MKELNKIKLWFLLKGHSVICLNCPNLEIENGITVADKTSIFYSCAQWDCHDNSNKYKKFRKNLISYYSSEKAW